MPELQLRKLIGFKLDTNQIVSKRIKNEREARHWFTQITGTYGEEILESMKLAIWEPNCFSAYMKAGMTLKTYLTEDVKTY